MYRMYSSLIVATPCRRPDHASLRLLEERDFIHSILSQIDKREGYIPYILSVDNTEIILIECTPLFYQSDTFRISADKTEIILIECTARFYQSDTFARSVDKTEVILTECTQLFYQSAMFYLSVDNTRSFA